MLGVGVYVCKMWCCAYHGGCVCRVNPWLSQEVTFMRDYVYRMNIQRRLCSF